MDYKRLSSVIISFLFLCPFLFAFCLLPILDTNRINKHDDEKLFHITIKMMTSPVQGIGDGTLMLHILYASLIRRKWLFLILQMVLAEFTEPPPHVITTKGTNGSRTAVTIRYSGTATSVLYA